MLSTDAARARLSTIPAGSRIVVTGTNDGQPFTDEGVLVRDGESFLLQRRRGVFIAFFQDGVEYDAITPKREQSVPPTWRARRVDREIEEDQDVGERRRPTPRRYSTRHADGDAAEAERHRTRGLHPEARLDDDVFDVPPPPPPPPPPTQPLPEEALIRAVRAVLSQQPAIVTGTNAITTRRSRQGRCQHGAVEWLVAAPPALRGASRLPWPKPSPQFLLQWEARHEAHGSLSTGYKATQERMLFLGDVPMQHRFARFEAECHIRRLAPTTAMTYYNAVKFFQQQGSVNPHSEYFSFLIHSYINHSVLNRMNDV
jgi:hypothetical protein